MRQDFKERDVEKSPTSDALQDSVGDISGEAFLHVDEDHPDADADRRRDGEDEDGGDGLASSEVRLRNVLA